MKLTNLDIVLLTLIDNGVNVLNFKHSYEPTATLWYLSHKRAWMAQRSTKPTKSTSIRLHKICTRVMIQKKRIKNVAPTG